MAGQTLRGEAGPHLPCLHLWVRKFCRMDIGVANIRAQEGRGSSLQDFTLWALNYILYHLCPLRNVHFVCFFVFYLYTLKLTLSLPSFIYSLPPI